MDMRPLMSAVLAVEEMARLTGLLVSRRELSMLHGEIRETHDKLLAFFDLPRPADEVHAILDIAERSRFRDLLIGLNARLHRCTEIALARRYLSSPAQTDPFSGSWINKGFSALLAQQVGSWRRIGVLGAPLSGPIVIVGGGALPQTQVALFRQLGCDVLAVERDPVSADLCRQVLAKAGYWNLRVANADGIHYDYSGPSIVVVATLVRDKALIARRVAQTAPGALFAPRTPVGLHAMWREALVKSDVAAHGWRLLDRCEPQGSSVAGLTFSRGG